MTSSLFTDIDKLMSIFIPVTDLSTFEKYSHVTIHLREFIQNHGDIVGNNCFKITYEIKRG